ncbi:hypothetical protein HZH66_010763 [Vespula vulgaris]|uniref:Uncharacterized protein n=1 Tax=Vespula vulgaris TaxID=7454 RepID=A0A834JGE4_VESVU|nr:hypothetical protein HZH66_010763 [Vespula vulgaris]
MGEGNVTLKLVSAYLQVSPYLRKTQTWSPRSLGKLGWRRAQCSEPRKQQWSTIYSNCVEPSGLEAASRQVPYRVKYSVNGGALSTN